jgi:acetyl-CoA acetyltransferase family protein
MHEALIVDAVRTPIGRHGGALSGVRPDDLAAIPIRALVERTGIDPARIEEVILGCANQAGEDNRNVARMAALLAGLPRSVAGATMNRLCASGLAAVNAAARAIKVGEGDVYVAGGVESMSRAPYSVPKGERGFPTGNLTAWDTTLGWRYPNPKLAELFPLEPMGETAENLQEQSCGSFAPSDPLVEIPGGAISRAEQDAFALESQRRAVAAIDSGRFRDEIVPVAIAGRKGATTIDRDEHPRYRLEGERAVLDTDAAALAALKPAFRRNGSVTAGNSSGLNDGAAALLLCSRDAARSLGLRPLARIVASAAAGVDPRVMGIGPVPAVAKALSRAGITMNDVGLVELNEAFAAQSIAVMRAAGMDPAITNVNGGAIALGHPLGCSGARILTTLVHEMRRRNAAGDRVRYGLATLCVGVGQGDATVVEWVGS